jgi:hypothetical protein
VLNWSVAKVITTGSALISEIVSVGAEVGVGAQALKPIAIRMDSAKRD